MFGFFIGNLTGILAFTIVNEYGSPSVGWVVAGFLALALGKMAHFMNGISFR